MGDAAEDLIDGLCCSGCTVFFIELHGYPVLCSSCFERAKADKGRWDPKTNMVDGGLQEALHQEC